MKQLIDIDQWIRKDQYLFFSPFEEPFFGVTAKVDVTQAYQNAKMQNKSVFLYYLYRVLKAANEIENFRYRIIDQKPFLFDIIHASPTINRPNGTFGFAYMNYEKEEAEFCEKAEKEIENVKNSSGLFPAISGENVIHITALPWIDFTSVSHARSFSFADSSPKISFGKIVESDGKKSMSVSVHVHHALADGYHIGLFFEKFQDLLNI
jgi:chloramphenicol O-acetyltransferase type A